jgi:hypothetical protein
MMSVPHSSIEGMSVVKGAYDVTMERHWRMERLDPCS